MSPLKIFSNLNESNQRVQFVCPRSFHVSTRIFFHFPPPIAMLTDDSTTITSNASLQLTTIHPSLRFQRDEQARRKQSNWRRSSSPSQKCQSRAAATRRSATTRTRRRSWRVVKRGGRSNAGRRWGERARRRRRRRRRIPRTRRKTRGGKTFDCQ